MLHPETTDEPMMSGANKMAKVILFIKKYL